MKSFLEYVAADLLRKYGTNLSEIVVVFPNKRAALFLNEHLARLAGKPLWSPTYITISELFRSHSQRQASTKASTISTDGDSCYCLISTISTRTWPLRSMS